MDVKTVKDNIDRGETAPQKLCHLDLHCFLLGVRSAMRAASQLDGRGHTDMDDAPAPAC